MRTKGPLPGILSNPRTSNSVPVMRSMLRITGTELDVRGLDRIPGNGPFVLMGNHRSHLDAAVLIYALPFLFGFIVKEELMKIPIFAGGMRASLPRRWGSSSTLL